MFHARSYNVVEGTRILQFILEVISFNGPAAIISNYLAAPACSEKIAHKNTLFINKWS